MSSTLFYDIHDYDDDVLNVAYYIEHNILPYIYISKGHVFEILILSICCVGLNFIYCMLSI